MHRDVWVLLPGNLGGRYDLTLVESQGGSQVCVEESQGKFSDCHITQRTEHNAEGKLEGVWPWRQSQANTFSYDLRIVGEHILITWISGSTEALVHNINVFLKAALPINTCQIHPSHESAYKYLSNPPLP